jgi:hypothetical protein
MIEQKLKDVCHEKTLVLILTKYIEQVGKGHKWPFIPNGYEMSFLLSSLI